MKLHPSVVEKLIYLFQTYGGYSDERKLRAHVQNLDLTPYERKTTKDQEMILVLTEDYLKELSQKR
jgi:hypothetical protein